MYIEVFLDKLVGFITFVVFLGTEMIMDCCVPCQGGWNISGSG